jgi:hypothetical protein
MRKVFVVLLLCLLVIPASVFAQDDVLELSQVVQIEALGIEFNAPDGWLVGSDDSALYVAQTQEDLDAATDGDPETKAAGVAVAVAVIPLEDMGMEDATLDDIATQFAGSAEVSDSGELTVNLRPAIYLLGTSTSNGETSYLAFWKQDASLVLFSVLVPSGEVDQSITDLFGTMLNTVRPSVAEDFVAAEERYEATDLGYAILYPEGWATVNAADITGTPGFVLAEIESDVTAEQAEGTVISVVQIPGTIEDLELTEESEVSEWVDAIAALLGIEEVESQGEFSLLGEWGVGFTGVSATSGRPGYAIVTYNADNEVFTVYVLTSPDAETLEYYVPIFQILLWSVTPLES